MGKVNEVFTPSEALECTQWWAKRLALSNWQFRVDIKRKDQISINGKPKRATANWNDPLMKCIITLMDPVDYYDDYFGELDHEIDIVHELIHVRNSMWDLTQDDTCEETMMEQSTQAMAEALVRLRREGGIEWRINHCPAS